MRLDYPADDSRPVDTLDTARAVSDAAPVDASRVVDALDLDAIEARARKRDSFTARPLPRCDHEERGHAPACFSCVSAARTAEGPTFHTHGRNDVLALVVALRASRAIIDGRAEPPTMEEIATASQPNSFWLCEHNGFAWLVRFVADFGVWIEVDGEPWEPVAPRLARLSPGRWWFLLNGRPCAWPTVPA